MVLPPYLQLLQLLVQARQLFVRALRRNSSRWQAVPPAPLQGPQACCRWQSADWCFSMQLI